MEQVALISVSGEMLLSFVSLKQENRNYSENVSYWNPINIYVVSCSSHPYSTVTRIPSYYYSTTSRY
jgi:hypothetical protein